VERERLDKKVEALSKKQADLASKPESLRRARTELNDFKNQHWGSVGMNEPLNLEEHDSDNEVKPVEPHPPGETNPFTYGKPNLQLTKLNPNRYSWDVPIDIKAKDKRVVSLRRHDYYSGWLDAVRAIDHQKALGLEAHGKKMDTRSPILGAATAYLRDRNDPRNLRNAGVNVGLLFAYSALYKQYNFAHCDERLDVREWDLDALKPVAREDEYYEFEFWYGVEFAVDRMNRLFRLKIERGIWKTGEDAAQIALMKTRDMKERYMVVPGRKIVPRNVHRLAMIRDRVGGVLVGKKTVCMRGWRQGIGQKR
jgi:hypothetical protein